MHGRWCSTARYQHDDHRGGTAHAAGPAAPSAAGPAATAAGSVAETNDTKAAKSNQGSVPPACAASMVPTHKTNEHKRTHHAASTPPKHAKRGMPRLTCHCAGAVHGREAGDDDILLLHKPVWLNTASLMQRTRLLRRRHRYGGCLRQSTMGKCVRRSPGQAMRPRSDQTHTCLDGQYPIEPECHRGMTRAGKHTPDDSTSTVPQSLAVR